MKEHEKINYVEFPATDIKQTKTFFQEVFNWSFVDYGPDYSAFSDQGIDGGFFKSELSSFTDSGSALLVFFSNVLSSTQTKIEQHGGTIIKEVYSFPGGYRFHFTEPSGNEFAVWSDNCN